MALGSEQFDKGKYKRKAKPGARKTIKKAQHKKQRLLVKQSPGTTPHYNRYDGWE